MVREGLRRYLTGSVPISIGLHLFALFLFLVIPLTANIVLPMVSVDLPEYVRLAPMPPPPEVAPPAPRREIALGASAARGADVRAPHDRGRACPSRLCTDRRARPTRCRGLRPAGGPGIGIGVDAPRGPDAAGRRRKPDPVRVADLPVAPRKIVDARPIYPEIARQAQERRHGGHGSGARHRPGA